METHPLTAFRESRGLSQAELADLLGVSRVAVTRWEAGTRHPGDKVLPTIARITGIPAYVLRPERAAIFKPFEASAA